MLTNVRVHVVFVVYIVFLLSFPYHTATPHHRCALRDRSCLTLSFFSSGKRLGHQFCRSLLKWVKWHRDGSWDIPCLAWTNYSSVLKQLFTLTLKKRLYGNFFTPIPGKNTKLQSHLSRFPVRVTCLTSAGAASSEFCFSHQLFLQVKMGINRVTISVSFGSQYWKVRLSPGS